MEGLRELMQKLTTRLDKHDGEVVATLQRVAKGELKMVETISPEEKEYARALFGWIAEVGPQKVWAKIQPVLADSATLKEGIAFDKLVLDEPEYPVLPTPGQREELKDYLKDKRNRARLAVLLMSYIFYDQFHYPQPETGVYEISGNPFQKVKWLYRYWFNQLEVAEEGSGLEEFFESQVLNFFKLIDPEFAYPPVRTFSVSCAGDLLAVDCLTPENTPHLFDDITDFYSTADIVSANLESTVDKKNPVGRDQDPGQPAKMNTSEAMFQKFRDEAKINFFSTATNHAMDWGRRACSPPWMFLRNRAPTILALPRVRPSRMMWSLLRRTASRSACWLTPLISMVTRSPQTSLTSPMRCDSMMSTQHPITH